MTINDLRPIAGSYFFDKIHPTMPPGVSREIAVFAVPAFINGDAFLPFLAQYFVPLGLVNDKGDINIKALRSGLESLSSHNSIVSKEIPCIGKLTFNKDDWDALLAMLPTA